MPTDPVGTEVFIDLISKLGIPTVVSGAILFLLFKYIPKFLDMWIQSKERQEVYYVERQKSYDEQMGVIARIAEQANQVIKQSTSVIERNNIVFEQGVQSNERVITAMNGVVDGLGRVVTEVENTKDLVARQDARAENMNVDIIKIKERVTTPTPTGKR